MLVEKTISVGDFYKFFVYFLDALNKCTDKKLLGEAVSEAAAGLLGTTFEELARSMTALVEKNADRPTEVKNVIN